MSLLNMYYPHLENINQVRFTHREIDIIACILNGRSAKTIPALLSISPKTVAVHIENIRTKAGCSSRESIIDFIEKSDKYLSIKNEYYANLLAKNFFEKSLKKISKIISPQALVCRLIAPQEENKKNSFIHQLEQDLKLAGFQIENKSQNDPFELIEKPNGKHSPYVFCLLPEENQSPDLNEWLTAARKSSIPLDRIIFLNQTGNQNALDGFKNIRSIPFSKKENYYISFFKILKFILQSKEITSIFNEIQQYLELDPIVSLSLDNTSTKNHPRLDHSITKYKRIIFWIFITLISSFLIYNTFNNDTLVNKNSPGTHSIRSDLSIPLESTFLNRPKLLDQMDSKFSDQADIQCLMLVGIGGAGKTTLARQYARKQQTPLIWEINAETREDLNTSFASLASALSKMEQDTKELRIIQALKNPEEREEKLLQFVKTRLKVLSNWLLIYDNVEKLSDIQKYFPHDTQAWGKGKVILTTRDHTLQNNPKINQALFIGGLDPQQKLKLFTQIMTHNVSHTLKDEQQNETKEFLKKIPPFPLDVSIAAYYLKVTNISYAEYIKNLTTYKEQFSNFQSNIIKEFGSYHETRYGIITLSLQKIIAESKDFTNLFLFTSLLNAKSIPRNLLENLRDNIIVDNYIYFLKKYSLIIDNPATTSTAALSFHQTTQDIIQSYITAQLSTDDKSKALNIMANGFDDYLDQVIEQGDFPKLKLMAGHTETFLENAPSLPDLSKGLLLSKLGSLYYLINDSRAQQTLKGSIELLKAQNIPDLPSEEAGRIARSFLHIGSIYTELRFDQEAKELVEKAIDIFAKGGAKNYADLSWGLSHLGNLYRKLGNYEKARAVLEESLRLNTEYNLDKKHQACTLAYLGATYAGLLGFLTNAMECLQKSSELYSTHFPQDYNMKGWILNQLGNVYRELGDGKKAHEYFEQSLFVYKKHFPEEHVRLGLVLAYLGNNCRALGDYKKSRDYLEKSLKIHKKYYAEDHLIMGWISFHLAKTYKVLGKHQEALELFNRVCEIYVKNNESGKIEAPKILKYIANVFFEKDDLKNAEKFITKSLNALKNLNDINAYKSLEILGKIYLRSSHLASEAKNDQESQKWKEKGLGALHQALKIVKNHFPENSMHIQRIESRIKDIQNNK